MVEMIYKTLISTLLIALFGIQLLFADDTEFGNYGYNLFSMTKSKVQMSKEIVYIQMSENGVKVRCKFWFYNHGKTQTLKVGFPDFNYFFDDDDNYTPVKNFKSIVNGKPIKLEYKSVKWIDSTHRDHNSYSKWDTTMNRWYVKTVKFPSNDTVIVENYYEGELGNTVDHAFATCAFVNYYLGSGSSWNGNIEHGIIIFDFTDFLSSDFIINPQNLVSIPGIKTTISENLAMFDFNNYTPPKYQLLKLNFYSGFIPDTYIQGLYDNIDFSEESSRNKHTFLEELQNNLFPKKLDRMSKEILARAGYLFPYDADNQYFKRKSWYKPNSNGNFGEEIDEAKDRSEAALMLKKYCRDIKPFSFTTKIDERVIKELMKQFEIK